MSFQQINLKYVKGKQVISLAAIILSIVGFLLDAFTYYDVYSTSQVWVQSLSILICITALLLFLVNRNKYSVFAYGLLSYSIITNILLTTIYIRSFKSFVNFTEANILSRDILFIVFYVVLSGFIIGRKHIISQGLMLTGLIFYFIFILKDVFFIENAAIYLVALTSFIYSLYFFVGTLNKLIAGLEESITVTDTLKQVESRNKQTLIEYQNSLLNLAKDESLFKNSIDHLFRRICSLAAESLKTSRVGIWILEDENKKLVRKYLYELSGGNDEYIFLEQKDFPQYFKALDKPFIMAINAFEHPDTKEFSDVYLKPLAIHSMLDCPIVMDGRIVGVICCENQHDYKQWSTEDVLFIQSLSVHISICYKNLLINDLLNQVRKQNVELIEKGNEIGTMNEELNSLNEELLTLNDSLEITVKRRTSELETQNKQLTEYAFINSHILRAPLARVLGLSHLISIGALSIQDKELLDALILSTNELDAIIKKISDLLYDGNNLSRSDIQTLIDRTINKIV